MAKPTLPTFPNVLNEPIVKVLMFPFGVVPGDTETERQAAYRRRALELRFQKLLLLFKHYGIKSSDKDCWCKLAWYLACDCVQGMQVIDRPLRPPRERGRPKTKWPPGLAVQLLDDVDLIRKQRRCGVADATQQLPKRYPARWNKYKPSTLETRYHELTKQREALKESIRPSGLLSELFRSENLEIRRK